MQNLADYRLSARQIPPVMQRFLKKEKEILNLIFLLTVKGTVRPDWICMRVVSLESPLKGHQPLYVFNFFIFDLEYLRSEF